MLGTRRWRPKSCTPTWSSDTCVPGLGALRLKEISVPVTDRFIKLTTQRSGPGTVKVARSVLSGMLVLAVRHGAIPSNPIRDVARIARLRKQVRALTSR
jgi:hypothetical protein